MANRMSAPDRVVLRRLHLNGARAHTITEAHLSRLIGLSEEGYARVYELDGGIYFAITEQGREQMTR